MSWIGQKSDSLPPSDNIDNSSQTSTNSFTVKETSNKTENLLKNLPANHPPISSNSTSKYPARKCILL